MIGTGENSPLYHKFKAIRKALHQEQIALPQEIELPVNGPQEMTALFNVADNLFRQEFSSQDLQGIFEKLANDSIEISTLKPQITALKKMRTAALILKSSFLIFDETHYIPPILIDLTRGMGKVQDKIKTKRNRSEIAQSAQDLLPLVKTLLEQGLNYPFTPSSLTSFQETIKNQLATVKKLLTNQRKEGIELHSIRKILRNFMNVFQLSAVYSLNTHQAGITEPSYSHIIFQYLHSIVHDLGQKNDTLVALKANNTSEKATNFQIEPKQASAIRNFLDAIETSFS